MTQLLPQRPHTDPVRGGLAATRRLRAIDLARLVLWLGIGWATSVTAWNVPGPSVRILHDFAPQPSKPVAAVIVGVGDRLFGTTEGGGPFNDGTVFSVDPGGRGLEVIHDFLASTDGSSPVASLLDGGDGFLYGTTTYGGIQDMGTIFRVRPDGQGFAVLHRFQGVPDGRNSRAALVTDGAGVLFGCASYGGWYGSGTVFRVNSDGSGFSVLRHLSGSDGRLPLAALFYDGAGKLYGVTSSGGLGGGAVFALKADGSGFWVLHSFAGGVSDGASPEGPLILDGEGTLYGTTAGGGSGGSMGTIFSISTDGTGFELLHSFGGSLYGITPRGTLVADGAGGLYGTTSSGGLVGAGVVYTLRTDGSGFSVLHSFDSTSEGSTPLSALVFRGAGALFGTASDGGPGGRGALFTMGTSGSDFSVVHGFSGETADGKWPEASLTADVVGNLYGTTPNGGPAGMGAVFKVSKDGTAQEVLHFFAGGPVDGRMPRAGLVLDAAGNLFGTTAYGGNADKGSVFTLKTDGSGFSLLHSFPTGDSEGGIPLAPLVLLGPDKLLGSASIGGQHGDGTIFTLNTDGTAFAVIYHFEGGTSGGSDPRGGLVLDGAGNLYGTTFGAGAASLGVVFALGSDGSAFQLLHSFGGGALDGSRPWAALSIDSLGNLYGTTWRGGTADQGTVFTVRTDGTGFGLLHSFVGGTSDGSEPRAPVILVGPRKLVGTTYLGGQYGQGTIFGLETDGSGFMLRRSFSGSMADGSEPIAGLVCRGHLLYGVTTSGGRAGFGTVFSIRGGTDTPAIYRASDRSWYLKNSNASGAADLVFPYGDPSDQAVKGDWDGDGDDTVGIYRDGMFFLKNSNAAGNADIVVGFGAPGDLPIAGDWDGDGIDTIGVYRPGGAAWFLRNTNTPGPPDISFTYGLANETPVAGDWDADGIDTVGIFRASDRQWYLHNLNAGGNAELVFPYGDPAQDVPVVGDWDGGGDDTVGIYRAALGEWFLKNTNEAGFADVNFVYGLVNEKPLAGDWDGN
ncbi:MAG: hypothetical protein HY825_05365 [Acidobacteria bacterium]|nr:hypothetical protein [Acidobacteriota bacterium]